tara:strand:+ start:270 stop:662 length:393 start_codon:yes stop_codon:yes gene_type:complete
MILGVGSDIVNIKRIEKTINKFGNKFIKRCFTEEEILKSEGRSNKIQSYAKRFAAKEACSKALGTGISQGIFWRDIGVVNLKTGKPEIILFGNAKKILKQLVPKNKRPKINLTLADENNLAYAMVVISYS